MQNAKRRKCSQPRAAENQTSLSKNFDIHTDSCSEVPYLTACTKRFCGFPLFFQYIKWKECNAFTGIKDFGYEEICVLGDYYVFSRNFTGTSRLCTKVLDVTVTFTTLGVRGSLFVSNRISQKGTRGW